MEDRWIKKGVNVIVVSVAQRKQSCRAAGPIFQLWNLTYPSCTPSMESIYQLVLIFHGVHNQSDKKAAGTREDESEKKTASSCFKKKKKNTEGDHNEEDRTGSVASWAALSLDLATFQTLLGSLNYQKPLATNLDTFFLLFWTILGLAPMHFSNKMSSRAGRKPSPEHTGVSKHSGGQSLCHSTVVSQQIHNTLLIKFDILLYIFTVYRMWVYSVEVLRLDWIVRYFSRKIQSCRLFSFCSLSLILLFDCQLLLSTKNGSKHLFLSLADDDPFSTCNAH